jgi:hypothetical protein
MLEGWLAALEHVWCSCIDEEQQHALTYASRLQLISTQFHIHASHVSDNVMTHSKILRCCSLGNLCCIVGGTALPAMESVMESWHRTSIPVRAPPCQRSVHQQHALPLLLLETRQSCTIWLWLLLLLMIIVMLLNYTWSTAAVPQSR